MSFSKTVHVDEQIEERINEQWNFFDTSAPQGQRFAVLSVVAPTGTNQKAAQFGIKIYGCFPTLKEANEYSQQLIKKCDGFDIYTLQTQSWAQLPPQVESLADQHFQEQRLEDLKNAVISQREQAKKRLRERCDADAAAKAVLSDAVVTNADDMSATAESKGLDETKGSGSDDQ